MTEHNLPTYGTSLRVRPGHPLIAIPIEREGEAETLYVVDDAAADDFLVQQQVIAAALATAGAFADLDYDEAMDALDLIRHASTPTPPIDPSL